MELIGWVGGFLLGICVLPQVWLCYRQGHAHGVSLLMLELWGVGEVFALTYAIHLQAWPLIANYALNLLIVLVILRYKLFPRKASVTPELSSRAG